MIRLNINESDLTDATNERPVPANCDETNLQVLIWARPDGGFIATELECPHQQGELRKQGRVVYKDDCVAVVCPKHTWYFDSETGKVFSPERAFSRWSDWENKPMKLWRVVMNGDGIFLSPISKRE